MFGVLIRKLETFTELSSEEKSFLLNAPVSVLDYAGHREILLEGEFPGNSSLVIDGLAFRFKILAGGNRQILSFHVPGDFFDLHSYVLKRMDHSIGVAGKCRIASVPHQFLEELTARYPRLMRAFMWDLALDGAICREWMVGMGRRSAYEKLGHLLCEFLVRLQVVGQAKDNSFELLATQIELADALGLSPVHVNRSMQALRSDGLIILKHGKLVIPDFNRLKDMSYFDPAYLHVQGGLSLQHHA